MDLETALADRAHELKLLGSTDTMTVRRAAALGDLARLQSTLTLSPDECVDADGKHVNLPARRAVVVHAHVAAAAITGYGYDPAQHGVATLTNTHRPVLTEQVRDLVQHGRERHRPPGDRPRRPPPRRLVRVHR